MGTALTPGSRRLRVFHGLVNYGTQAGLFARALRRRGIDAFSAVRDDRFERCADLHLPEREGGLLKQAGVQAAVLARRLLWFFRYNTFHFYFGTSLFPCQWDLPLYRRLGKKVILHYLGWDVQLYQESIEKYEHTNARYYRAPDQARDEDAWKKRRLQFETRYANLQLVCAPYLSEFVARSTVLPLAVDVEEIRYCPKPAPEREVVVMHAPTHRGHKGSSYILSAIHRLRSEGYALRPLIVENVTHRELMRHYQECDVFVDQVLAGWYGTAAIEAMATGRPVVGFFRESYFQHIEYGNQIPIVNANPDSCYLVLKRLLDRRQEFPALGARSRHFVENVHNLNALTDKLVELYQQVWGGA
jgi:glycosyltransferase involved in cell wall biosynthesis